MSQTIHGDTRVEFDEYFYATLSSASGQRARIIQNRRSTRINILDNDAWYRTIIYFYCSLNNIYYLAVAVIGMEQPAITRTESRTSISLCIVVINRVQLDIDLSASIETHEITATG